MVGRSVSNSCTNNFSTEISYCAQRTCPLKDLQDTVRHIFTSNQPRQEKLLCLVSRTAYSDSVGVILKYYTAGYLKTRNWTFNQNCTAASKIIFHWRFLNFIFYQFQCFPVNQKVNILRPFCWLFQLISCILRFFFWIRYGKYCYLRFFFDLF